MWADDSAATIRQRLAENLARFEWRPIGDSPLRRAAVAVMAGFDGTAPAVLLTRRSARLRGHAGQWAFPGGRLDAGETPLEAAIREAREEVNARLDEARHLLGRLDDYETRSGYVITPFVFWHPLGALTPNPDEVASLHPIRFEAVAGGRPAEFLPGPDPARPILRLHLGAHDIHAPTAAILHQFHHVALEGRDTRVAHLDQPDWAR